MAIDLLHASRVRAERLLLRTANPAADAALPRDRTVDWNWLTHCAIHERAAGPVLRRLQQMAPDVARTLAELRGAAYVSDFRMLQLERRLAETLDALRAASIPVLLLKGAAVVAATGASMRERPMLDIDLLIHPHDAARASVVVQSCGWTLPPRPGKDAFYTEHHHLQPMVDAVGGSAEIELHVAPLGGRAIPLTAGRMWRGAVPVADGVWRPDATLLLLHACVHFAWAHGLAHGAWRTVRDVCLLGAHDVDWERLVVDARGLRAVTSVRWTLWLAAVAAGAPVPDGVLRALDAGRSTRLDAVRRRHVRAVSLGTTAPAFPTRLLRRLWELVIEPSASGHGRERPWHSAERWDAMPGATGTEAGDGAGSARRVARLRSVVGYLSRATR